MVTFRRARDLGVHISSDKLNATKELTDFDRPMVLIIARPVNV